MLHEVAIRKASARVQKLRGENRYVCDIVLYKGNDQFFTVLKQLITSYYFHLQEKCFGRQRKLSYKISCLGSWLHKGRESVFC